LRHETFDPNFNDATNQLVASANTAKGGAALSRLLAKRFEKEAVNLAEWHPMMPASGFHRTQLALVDPLLQAGVADAQGYGGIARTQQFFRLGRHAGHCRAGHRWNNQTFVSSPIPVRRWSALPALRHSRFLSFCRWLCCQSDADFEADDIMKQLRTARDRAHHDLPPTFDRRNRERITLDIPLRIYSFGPLADKSCEAKCVDLSEGGVSFETVSELTVGDVVILEFQMKGEAPYRCHARLTYRMARRYGGYFLAGP
jgi:hypothetical protein